MRNFGYTEKGQVGSLLDVQIWKRILGYCRSYLPGLALAVLLSFLVTGATLGLPKLVQVGIDNYIGDTVLTVEEQIHGLAGMALNYLILVVLIFFCSFLQVVILEWVGQMIMHELRQQLFSHLLSLEVRFFQDHPVGRLVTRLTNDIQNMHEMFTSVIVTLFNDFLKLAGILIVLYLMNLRLAGLMTIFLPLSFFLTILFSRLARERFRSIRSQLARLNSFLQESITNMSVVQLFGRERKLARTHSELCQGYLQRTFAQIRLFGTFFPLTEFMSASAIALILWYGGGEVIGQTLTLGELVAFITYMRLFFQPMRELSQKYSIVQSAMASAERIFQLLDTPVQMKILEPVTAPEHVVGSIRFKNVSFGYTRGEPVLHNLDISIPTGKVTALVGATGSGKSSLAALLVRFYDPVSGVVLLDDRDIRRYPLGLLRQKIGIIMQDVFLLPDSIRTNITIGSEIGEDAFQSLVEKTGLKTIIDRLPAGLETVIGEGGVELSAGEKQLIAFVRVLARNPAVLIFDEATASIDTESENILEQAVQTGFHDRTVLIIAHRLSTVRRADHILVMEKGCIVEQGDHDTLLNRQGVYKKLVEIDLLQGRQVGSPV